MISPSWNGGSNAAIPPLKSNQHLINSKKFNFNSKITVDRPDPNGKRKECKRNQLEMATYVHTNVHLTFFFTYALLHVLTYICTYPVFLYCFNFLSLVISYCRSLNGIRLKKCRYRRQQRQTNNPMRRKIICAIL